MFSSLENKVVLITGASSGIGAASAVEFARLGCRVSLCGQNVRNLHTTAIHCVQANGGHVDKVYEIIGDVTQVQDCERMIDQTVTHFGQLHVLVNNAGILGDSSLENFSLEAYNTVLSTNLQAPVLLTKLAVPYLEITKGCVVNVSSFSGLRPTSGVLFYALSKSALDQFTRIASVELGAKGIRVNSVNPGVVATNCHYRSGFSEEHYKQYLSSQQHVVPLGRYAEAKEVATCILFLASDEASFINGVCLMVDGGRQNVVPRAPAKL